MSLLDEYKKEYIIMEKNRVSDGEGGFTTTWAEGSHVYMAEAHNTTIEAQVAEQDNTASTYSFLHDKSISFDYHDVIKRADDGQIFRITAPSGEDYTPASSRLNLSRITAEKWSLPS